MGQRHWLRVTCAGRRVPDALPAEGVGLGRKCSDDDHCEELPHLHLAGSRSDQSVVKLNRRSWGRWQATPYNNDEACKGSQQTVNRRPNLYVALRTCCAARGSCTKMCPAQPASPWMKGAVALVEYTIWALWVWTCAPRIAGSAACLAGCAALFRRCSAHHTCLLVPSTVAELSHFTQDAGTTRWR